MRRVEARAHELGDDPQAVGLAQRAAGAPDVMFRHAQARAIAGPPIDQTQALEPRVESGDLRGAEPEFGDDLVEAPFIADQPEHREQARILRERGFLLEGQLDRPAAPAMAHAGKLVEIHFQHPEDFLQALQGEAALREQALHGRRGNAQRARQVRVRHAAGLQDPLQCLDDLARHCPLRAPVGFRHNARAYIAPTAHVDPAVRFSSPWHRSRARPCPTCRIQPV